MLWCCGCDRNVVSTLVDGTAIHPRLPRLAFKKFWRCPTCKNYVGAHASNYVPLGVIPTPDLRHARSELHGRLDPLWQAGLLDRKAVYAWLTERTGKEFRIAELRTMGEVAKAHRLISVLKTQLHAEQNGVGIVLKKEKTQ